jgi:hypothetical protein
MPLIVKLYEFAKNWLVETSGIAKDAWHVYIALAIQLAVAQLFRQRLASPWPVLIVLLLELVNEWFDLRHYSAAGPDPMAGWTGDTARDLFNSLALPLAVFLIARFGPNRVIRPAPAASETPAE